MNRHATLDELARLHADDLRPRKAARISQHLAECADCAETNGQLSGIPMLLSSVKFPGMPDSLSARIDSALAVEAAQRVAQEPATEAGRRDLPARSAAPGRGRPRFIRPHSARLAWGMPVPAARVLATAAAILVVGAGGYVIASHSGGAAPPSSAGSAAGLTPFAEQASTGPAVTYREGRTDMSIMSVTSGTNFKAATLAGQAAVAVSEAKIDRVRSVAVKGSGTTVSNGGIATPTSLATPTYSVAGAPNALGVRASPSNTSQLTGCVDRVIGPRQVVLLVERARFDGKPATIIVTVPASARATSPPQKAQIWAVGQTCSATTSDVLDHVKVARL